MKIYNKIIALVAALGLVGVSFAQDEAAGGNLTDNISIAGFVTGSWGTTDPAVGADTESIGIDEVEIDFLFGFGSVSAEVHLDAAGATPATAAEDIGIEQAFVTYDAGNGFSVTLGKYGSALGLEGADPTSLATVSRAYNDSNLNLGDVDNNVAEGIAVTYSADAFSVAISLEDGERTNIDSDKLNTEVSVSYTGIENLAIGGGVYSSNGTAVAEYTNIHATYNAGKALIAAEWTEQDNTGATADVDAMLVMVNYEVSDKVGLAIRYSEEDSETANGSDDVDKLTIAPSYAITDDLGAILEISDGEIGTTDNESVSLQLTLTF